jgi:hypothetical protein
MLACAAKVGGLVGAPLALDRDLHLSLLGRPGGGEHR